MYPPFSILSCGYPGGDGQTTGRRRTSVTLCYVTGAVMLCWAVEVILRQAERLDLRSLFEMA
jgi:hypothetical protein